jgi:hypothetical protein
MKKQTAIDWLISELKDNGFDHIDLAEEIIKEAKEMHKNQIQDAFEEGKWNGYETAIGASDFKDPLIYYNETFES